MKEARKEEYCLDTKGRMPSWQMEKLILHATHPGCKPAHKKAAASLREYAKTSPKAMTQTFRALHKTVRSGAYISEIARNAATVLKTLRPKNAMQNLQMKTIGARMLREMKKAQKAESQPDKSTAPVPRVPQGRRPVDAACLRVVLGASGRRRRNERQAEAAQIRNTTIQNIVARDMGCR